MPDTTIDAQVSPETEAELMAAFRIWFDLWCRAGRAYGAERNDLDAQAAAVFNAQVARGGAYRAAWILMQDTLSAWWELPEQMREFLRTAPLHEGFSRRAMRAVVALDAAEDASDDED